MTENSRHQDALQRIKSLERLLSIKQLQINSLLEVSQAINNNFSPSALFRIYEFVLRAQIGVQKILVFIESDGWMIACKSGIDHLTQDISVDKDLMPYKKITKLSLTDNKKLQDYEILIPVYHKDSPLAYVLIGDIKTDDFTSIEEKIKFIQTITNIIIVANENKRLFKNVLTQEIFKKELELAAKMQAMLIPHELPHDELIEMAAVYLPHHDVGGDYYDYIVLNDDESAFCIGDISGKGIAAALLMANFQANLRTHINEYERLDKLVSYLNESVNIITKGEKFITLFLGVYNNKTRLLRYVNAGHNPSLLQNNGKLVELKNGCTILGMFEKLPSVTAGQVTLEKDAVLVNYTDGVVDFENDKNEFFGMDRFVDYFRQNHHLPMDTFNQKLLRYIDEFKGASTFEDDITLLSCRFY